MKFLIAGLGNIGSEYEDTRHNIGFQVVDAMAKQGDATWKQVALGSMTEVKHKGRTLILLKPNTYMNLSGKAVAYWMQKEKIQAENVLVVTDEIQLELGTIRLRGKGSDGGHNGLKNIQEVLGTSEFPRLRVGIGKNFNMGGQVNYVLGEWTADEKKHMPEILKACEDAVKSFVSIGLKRAMDVVNAKKSQPGSGSKAD